MQMPEIVILMRGINVGGNRKMPMAELRALCDDLGFANPQTYIQSGNLLIGSGETPAKTEDMLANAISRHFGFEVPLIVRAANTWKAYIDNNPFAGDDRVSEKMLHLLIAATSPPESAVAMLCERAQGGENIRRAGDAIWIDYCSGVARSKLTPAAIDKAFGATATGRNLRTVCKLQDMIEERKG